MLAASGANEFPAQSFNRRKSDSSLVCGNSGQSGLLLSRFVLSSTAPQTVSTGLGPGGRFLALRGRLGSHKDSAKVEVG